jgi:hypothetical protein
VHLNPKRAGLVGNEARLETYPWSSYPGYLKPRLREEWLRTDRVLGEHGLEADTAKNRREFSRRMEGICAVDLAGEYQPLRRGWKLGGEDFRDWLADKLADAHSDDPSMDRTTFTHGERWLPFQYLSR